MIYDVYNLMEFSLVSYDRELRLCVRLEFNQNVRRVQIHELDSHELTTKSLITPL